MSPKLPVAATAALAFAGVLLCAPASAQSQVDVLKVRAKGDIRSTDPGMNRDSPTDAVMAHVVEGLVAYREDATVVPMLAESVQVSPDGRVYTFRLRKGVRFHNGAPLTADDVLYSWQRYMQPANNWRCLPEFDGRGASKVMKLQAKDAHTVVFTLEQPTTLFLATLARTDCGMAAIYHRDSIDAAGKWKAPIGTGPFKLGEWKRGQYLELIRNEAYAALPGKPDGLAGNKTAEVGRIRYVIIPDSSAAKAALLSGNIDLDYDVLTENIAELKTRKELILESAPSMDKQAILFQTRNSLLKDPRLRRAIALSLDVPELVSAVTTDTAQASRSILSVASGFHKAAQAAVPKRDLVQARRLLAAAGYRGQPIKLLTTKRFDSLYGIAVMAQAMAQEAGIRLEIEVLEWATLLDRYNKGDYQAMAFAFSARLDPALAFEMIAGDKDKQPRKVWDAPDALDQVARLSHVTDARAYQALLDQLEAGLRDQVPAVFLYSSVTTSAARKNVKGYRSWVFGEARLWGVSVTKP